MNFRILFLFFCYTNFLSLCNSYELFYNIFFFCFEIWAVSFLKCLNAWFSTLLVCIFWPVAILLSLLSLFVSLSIHRRLPLYWLHKFVLFNIHFFLTYIVKFGYCFFIYFCNFFLWSTNIIIFHCLRYLCIYSFVFL